MTRIFATLTIFLLLCSAGSYQAVGQTASVDETKAKFQQDLKAAVLDGAITVPQLRELQSSVDRLKAFRETQRNDGAIDLLTPYRATSDVKRIVNSTDAKHRKLLQDDLQALLAAQARLAAASSPNPSAGEKLGKDIFRAITSDDPSEQQVRELQENLIALHKLKTDHPRPLQALATLHRSKSRIAAVIGSTAFSPDNQKRVREDLDHLRS